jgi:hypothetical protein
MDPELGAVDHGAELACLGATDHGTEVLGLKYQLAYFEILL